MRDFQNNISIFVLGGFVGWAITYVELTRESRRLKRIKSHADTLALYHDLPRHQYDQVSSMEGLATDADIQFHYRWALLAIKEWKLKVNPEMVAAECIICVNLLGLTHSHAFEIIKSSKTRDDLKEALREIKSRFPNRFPEGAG